MTRSIYIFYILCLATISATDVQATHNRSGEITYEQIGPLTIRATITTYTKASSASADRDTLTLNWGDNESSLVSRFNGDGELVGEDIKVNIYIAEHTYPGRATYTLSFGDPNRVNNIVNVNFPNSVDVPFFVSTTFTLIQTQFQGFNSSVILLQPPIDFACINQRFVHNPNAYDIDGDSIAYELVTPMQAEGSNVPSYKFPNEVSPGLNNNISLNPVTGDFVWDAPQQSGEYNIAIKIKEYRNGVLLNSVIRDMQIRVESCESIAPTISTVDEICVIAGETINLPILIQDVNADDLVRVTATGGPFIVSSPSEIIPASLDYQAHPLNVIFRWETKCEHISNAFYQIVIRAQDNSLRSNSGLTTLKTVKIRVVGPAPENLQADIQNQAVRLEWDDPYRCENADNEYFLGFKIWRRVNSTIFQIDTCDPGIEGKGYEIVDFLSNDKENGKYFNIDTNIEKGKIYCYRIEAQFALRTSSDNPFNIVESLPSNEICIQLQQDFPLITEVSVRSTNNVNGEINLSWIKPLPSDFDTIENPGPYNYRILRSEDGTTFNEIPGTSFQSMEFGQPKTFSYLDSNLNTSDIQYHYIIDLDATGSYYSSSPESSSIYLRTTATDKRVNLNWSSSTSWTNYSYTILRRLLPSDPFINLGETSSTSFVDRQVINDLEYCYVIESQGNYGLSHITSPLINLSEEKCAMPIDTVGPCAPDLIVINPCSPNFDGDPENNQFNQLNWTMSNLVCLNNDDIAGYNVYYAPHDEGTFVLIANVDKSVNNYQHLPEEGINGCYKISAVDTLGNEGPLSGIRCVSNCPIYILPNTFTPNNDGANDVFVPMKNKFVSSVDFKVFNKWGNEVFQTFDAELNWNGMTAANKQLDQGTYYYTCRLFDFSVEGEVKQVDYISGFINLFR